MGHNYHSLSIDATIMVSKNCPITGRLSSLFSEHQAHFFSHWAAYGATATHTTLIIHPSPAFRQYFFPGFKRDFAVGFQTSRVTGWSLDYVSNIKSARLNRSDVEPFLARIYQLWRVTGPLASFSFASPSGLIRSGVLPRRGRPGKWRPTLTRRTTGDQQRY